MDPNRISGTNCFTFRRFILSMFACITILPFQSITSPHKTICLKGTCGICCLGSNKQRRARDFELRRWVEGLLKVLGFPVSPYVDWLPGVAVGGGGGLHLAGQVGGEGRPVVQRLEGPESKQNLLQVC